MSDSSDDAWLIALGAAISDGGPIDWDRAEQRVQNLDQRRLVQELRQLSLVVNAHRSAAAPPEEAPAERSVSPTATEWRHLLLFECLGTGAFGTVYRGWDPQLDREVAVKLLPRGDSGRRPLDEARNLARVRHSNVVVVHGADEDADRAGIWMELIEGQTLAQIVRERGPMSPREVAGIGLDLCSALSAIHAAGLLHQDIKAQNVMREVGGRIVLMDFSGADVVDVEDGPAVRSGTPLYMAPELFDGALPTTASDVYSLGVLLFFLLAGRLPIEGQSLQDVKQAHARRDRRRLRDMRPDVPDGLVQVIERATAHDVSARYRTPGELEHALASASGAHAIPSLHDDPSRATGAAHVSTRRAWATAAAIVVFAAVVAAPVSRAPKTAPRPLVARFTVGPPHMSAGWPRVSPDGRLLVFGTFVEGRNRFWIRQLDQTEGRAILESTADESPFWSPDSRTLAFFDAEKLYRVPVNGGGRQLLAEVSQPRGGDWDGTTILYGSRDGIYRMESTGGPAHRVTTIDAAHGEFQHGWPEFLPDGRRFLYVVRSSRPERAGIYLGALDGAASRRLLPAYSRAVYADGHLLYVRDAALTAHPFDPRAGVLRGEPRTIASSVRHHGGSDAAFDVSPAGVLIYNLTSGPPPSRLVLFDRRGRELRVLADAGSFGHPRFSPDGQRIVAEKINRENNNADLWVYGITRPSATRLTRGASPDIRPSWSPDGRRIAFSSRKGSFFDLFAKTVDGIEDEQLVLSTTVDKYVEHWSPDGRYLLGTVLRSGLWLLTLGGGGQPQLLRGSDRPDTWQAEFSPDGRWLAYMSLESGAPEVHVEPFPPTGSRWQVSDRGGAEPHWRGDSRELLFIDAANILTAVRFSAAPWNPAPTQKLFPVSILDRASRADYTISPDGRYVVVNTFVADPIAPLVDVVLNWTGLLER
jgi:eukaryotic-like serine/threonine-protein kinase